MTVNLKSQSVIEGRIVSAVDKLAVENANILTEPGASGSTTDKTGKFRLKVPAGHYSLLFSAVGFVPKRIVVSVGEGDNRILGDILLDPEVIALEGVNIISSVADERKTPVALTTIFAGQLETQLGDQPYPVIMKMVPGVYPTRTGGGSGDAQVNIRGFQQENVALLLNGIPISSVEN
nr:carboxypeptidase-like regulatory domain-containing protein [Bacteroidota bacterium]